MVTVPVLLMVSRPVPVVSVPPLAVTPILISAVPLVDRVTARVVSILSQLAIVIGMVLVGLRHFDSIKTGIAAATLYLLLPYTAMWTGSVTHALPGALLVWAIVFYRWPLLAGGSATLLSPGHPVCAILLRVHCAILPRFGENSLSWIAILA